MKADWPVSAMGVGRLAAALCALAALTGGPAVGQPAQARAPEMQALQSRVVPLQGQANFRDIGGYRTRDGRQVKWGVIYRSGDLSALTPADYQKLAALHIRAICDLRNAAERERRPTHWAAGEVQTFVSDKPGADAAARALMAATRQTPAEARDAMKAYYAQMPEIFAPEYRVVFRRLVEGDTPLLLHCTAGKDRSGLAAALILLAVGVPRSTVVQDYVLTDTLLRTDRLPAMPGASPETLAVLYRADPAYIAAAIDAIDARYGSVESYLDRELGVGPADLLVLRRSLLEPGAGPGLTGPSAP